MMTSLDGRIDCAMVGRLEGVKEYYTALEDLDLPTTLSGRVTAQTEMALPGVFQAKDKTACIFHSCSTTCTSILSQSHGR